ncbi:MAG: glycine cleavage system protein GcvH [Bauldia sp.]|nr:glycine cleavage system protein GcvH [Bauldia sp.]
MTTRYTKDSEWIRTEGDEAVIGISDYAQGQLGDIVFVELPEVGKTLAKGDVAAVVESVKAASEVYAPAAGEVIAVNTSIKDDPSAVNRGAEGDGWFVRIKLKNPADIDSLMDAEAYGAFVAAH